MATAADMAKQAATTEKLSREVEQLRGKVAQAEKRAQAEAELMALMKDPRAPFDLRPVDVEDFLQKRAQLEALPNQEAMRTAVKIASRGSFDVGQSDDAETSQHSPVRTGSKAEDDFVNGMLAADANRG